jgi:hypothetical protein
MAYADHYKHDDVRVISHKGELFIERPFSLMLGTIEVNTEVDLWNDGAPVFIRKLTILWSGRLDMAVTCGDENVFVFDHKTTSMMGPTYFKDFLLSQQMQGYVWALRQIMSERNILGSIINVIAQRKPTKSGKSLEFARQAHLQASWQQDEWKNDVMREIEHFVHCLTTKNFPKAPKWCFGKYGQCQYHDVCTLPPEQRIGFLNGMNFKNVTWNPLD